MMLELYQFEGCPYSARVRAALSERQVDYVLRNEPTEPSHRERLRRLTGQTAVPTLVDQDHDVVIAGDDERIIAYLQRCLEDPRAGTDSPPPYNADNTEQTSPESPKGYE
ncbi:hypothetical protein YTPLAS18_15800 [Nitrospira sp.]|nr:hypothetical protein YTPLAS18_15800 [Nitrospira sp.]